MLYSKISMTLGYTGCLADIRCRMIGFHRGFRAAVIREFLRMTDFRESDGCLSSSVCLLICARYYGYDAVLRYGICDYKGIRFAHAWLDVDGRVFDTAIYGNFHFAGQVPFMPKRPVINTSYEMSSVRYMISDHEYLWRSSDMSVAVGHTVSEYFDASRNQRLWGRVCYLLDLPQNVSTLATLRYLADSIVI